MKNISLLAILCIGLLTFYFSCERDNFDDSKTEQGINVDDPVIKVTTLKQANKKLRELSNTFNLSQHFDVLQEDFGNVQKRDGEDSDFTIRTEVIKEITFGDYTSYTMFLESLPEADSSFYNITIEDKSGTQSMFITKYVPTQEWLDDKTQPYTGEVSSRKATELENPFEGISGGIGSFDPFVDSCNGTVMEYTIWLPYACGCGHMPWDSTCSGSSCGDPFLGGFTPQTVYECIPDDSPPDGDGNPNDNGSNGTGNSGDSPNDEDDPYTDEEQEGMATLITEDELTEECQIPGDLNGDCEIDAVEACQLSDNSPETCECVANGSTLEECLYEEAASTALFKKKDDEESEEVLLSLILQCFDTTNNQNGFHDVTIYVKQPVPNSSEVSVGFGDAGHTFIQLTQGLNGNTVTQVIGFYPYDDDVSPNNPNVEGVFLDDSGEEYDVSLNIELSSTQFNNIIGYLQDFVDNDDGYPEYDLNDFNCSDFGLQIMNFSDVQIPDSTGEWGGEYGFDLGAGTCPALLGQDLRNTNFGPNTTKDLDGGTAYNSINNYCD